MVSQLMTVRISFRNNPHPPRMVLPMMLPQAQQGQQQSHLLLQHKQENKEMNGTEKSNGVVDYVHRRFVKIICFGR
jgi:hypothetical protein